MKQSSCRFTLENGCLTLSNSVFFTRFEGIRKASADTVTPQSRSLPYFEVTAHKEDGRLCHYQMWEDLPVVRMVEGAEAPMMTLTEQHWVIKSVKLKAFTDYADLLTVEQETALFDLGLWTPLEGELFFFEDMESDRAFILISENPDWCTGTLSMPRKTGALTLDSKGYPVVYGECRRGECEALCRAYLRHANHCPELVTMSNTWGDCNSADRVCEAFIRKEIEAAKEMGVDIVQIDDGWQSGNILFKNPRDERGNRTFDGPYWDMNRERFPNGVRPLTEEAAKDGIRVGMWFAPSSHHCFALLERDKAALRKAYEEEGARFFKLDMYQAESKEETDKMLELLAEIYSFGPDVSVQMDVTRYSRLNYLCGREYGTIFVENRYTKTANSFPHRVLRNLWNLSRYLPTNRFQFELVNPDLNRESYGEKDPFAPALYEMDYLFATVMLSNPLFWMEMQFLSEERRRQLAPIMKVWKEHRSVLSRADVMPVGERPCGRSISGFYLSENGKPAYLLLFREVTDRDTATISLPVDTAKAQVLISNADVSVSVENGVARATFSKPRSYAFVKLD